MNAPPAGQRYWDLLSDEQRGELGGELEAAYAKGGTVGMWIQLHDQRSQPRAILEVAWAIGLIHKSEYDSLRREVAAVDPTEADIEDRVKNASQKYRLVLVKAGRAPRVYWDGRLVRAAWDAKSVTWDMLWELAQSAQKRSALRWDEVIGGSGERTLTVRRARLKKVLPASLNALIIPEGDEPGAYRLDLEPSKIKLIEVPTGDVLWGDGSEGLG